METKVQEAAHKAIVEMATNAATDSAATLIARCIKSSSGKAKLTITVGMIYASGMPTITGKWSVNDKSEAEKDELPETTIDPNQPKLMEE